MVGAPSARTVNEVSVVSAPLEVVTVIGPVVAPGGTVATTVVPTKLDVTAAAEVLSKGTAAEGGSALTKLIAKIASRFGIAVSEKAAAQAVPVVGAIAAQAVLFGIAHVDPARGVGNVGLVMITGAIGAAFGVSAYLLRRIEVTILAHAILNGVVMAIVLSGVFDDVGN